jgi:hypothetical protein
MRLSVALVWLLCSGAPLLACSARNKVPQGPPPEYERTQLPPWPPIATASASAEPASAPLQANEPPRGGPNGTDEAAPQRPNSTSPAPEVIDPPQGSR